jgi:hypothetical protein
MHYNVEFKWNQICNQECFLAAKNAARCDLFTGIKSTSRFNGEMQAPESGYYSELSLCTKESIIAVLDLSKKKTPDEVNCYRAFKILILRPLFRMSLGKLSVISHLPRV